MIHSKNQYKNTFPRIKKKKTYTSLLIEAFRSSPQGRCTTQEIFAYLEQKYPSDLTPALAHIWKNCIRQFLSKDLRFIKMGRRRKERLNEWVFFPFPGAYGSNKKEKKTHFDQNWMQFLISNGLYNEFHLRKTEAHEGTGQIEPSGEETGPPSDSSPDPSSCEASSVQLR